jgi:hypothetical protein
MGFVSNTDGGMHSAGYAAIVGHAKASGGKVQAQKQTPRRDLSAVFVGS